MVDVSTKACSECGGREPDIRFARRADRPGRVRTICTTCERKSRNTKYATSAETRAVYRNASRRYRTGVTLERYNEMFAEQRGCCGICKRHQSESKKTFAVDHDHERGLIRGLLCNECNLFLGLAYDSPEILLAAVAYLKSHQPSAQPAEMSKE